MPVSEFFGKLQVDWEQSHVISILIVSSLTFVAYEGFQLVINGVNEMSHPEKKIPGAIYTAVFLVIIIYVVISIAAMLAIPSEEIVAKKEFSLAAGAGKIIGIWGTRLVVVGAVLATSSAISGTLFGSSRQMAVIAADGFFPRVLARRKNGIPRIGIITMALTASTLILVGGLELILEFGSVTFLLVSLLMAIANFKIRKQTNSSIIITLLAILCLTTGTVLILYYEYTHQWEQLLFIISLYVILTGFSWFFSTREKRRLHREELPG